MLRLVNVVPEELRRVHLCDDVGGKEEYKAFSAFSDTDPDVVPCRWQVLHVPYVEDVAPIACDDHTTAVLRSGSLVSLDDECAVLFYGTTSGYFCMTCDKPLTDPLFCAACGFAAYCNETCAAVGWAVGHSSLCKCISRVMAMRVHAVRDAPPSTTTSTATKETT